MNYFLTSVIALLTGGGFAFIQFLIQRKDETQLSIKRSIIRIELLLMMSDYPDEHSEIMEIAHKYFVEFKGDWYMHHKFRSYCKKENIEIPTWVE